MVRLFPFDDGRLAPASVCLAELAGIRSLVRFGNVVNAPSPSSALPPAVITRRTT